MVLAPVLGGFIVRFVAGQLVEKILPLLPWISVLGICYVLLVVVSGSVDKILTSGALIIAVVICHNLLGYLFGYLAGRVGRGSDKAARTTAIESAVQNSALAATAGEDPLRRHPRDRAPGGRLLCVAQPLWRAPGGLLPSLEERWPGLKRRGLGALGHSCRADGWGWRVDTARADR